MSRAIALKCRGLDGDSGCGQPIAMAHEGKLYVLRTGTVLQIDKRGRAKITCRWCGKVTDTTGGVAPETSQTSSVPLH